MPKELNYPVALAVSPTQIKVKSPMNSPNPGSSSLQVNDEGNWFNNNTSVVVNAVPPPATSLAQSTLHTRRSTLQEEYEEEDYPVPALDSELKVSPVPCRVMRTVCNRHATLQDTVIENSNLYQHRAFVNVCTAASLPLSHLHIYQGQSSNELIVGLVDQWIRNNTLYVLVNSPKLGVAVVPVASTSSTPSASDKQTTRSKDIMIYDVIVSEALAAIVGKYLSPLDALNAQEFADFARIQV